MTAASAPAATKIGSPEPTCEFCDKRGLPVLLTRFAVATADSGAPTNPPAGGSADLGSSAHYTTRLLRPGYLYTFDEARNHWAAYLITSQGFLMSFPVGKPLPPSLLQGREPCARTGHRELAGLVTIPDARHATKIWFGFSDVEWTADTLSKHGDAAYRKRHMSVMDVKAWLAQGAGANQPLRPIVQVSGLVSEYVTASEIAKFKFGPFPFIARHGEATGLITKADACLKDKGAILILNDPAGIAQELAALMQHKTQQFMRDEHADKDRIRKVALSAAIDQLEEGIKLQAENKTISDAEERAEYFQNPYPFPGDESGYVPPPDPAAAAQARIVSAAQLDHAGDDAWQKYADQYKVNDKTNWQNDFNQALQQFDKTVITPLALAHKSWMTAAETASYFDCNFDPANLDSGAAYAEVFTLSILGTQDKGACASLYTDWLSATGLKDKKNLLLRAVCFNQDSVAEKVEEASKSAINWADMPWDKLNEGLGKSYEQVYEKANANIAGRLVAAIAGALADQLAKSAWANKVCPGLVAISALAKSPIFPVEITGGKKAFRALLIRHLMKTSGAVIPQNQMQKAVSDELRRLEIRGAALNGTDSKRWLLMIDPDQIQRMPKGLTKKGQVEWLMKSIRTPEQMEDLKLAAMNARLKFGNASFPFAFGVIGVVANCVAMNSILEEDAKTLAQNKGIQSWKIGAQIAQVAGATAEAIETAIAKLPFIASRAGPQIIKAVEIIFGIGGKVLSIAGALLMGAIDIWRGAKELFDGHWKAGCAYFASAALGIAATLFLAFGWTGIGLVLVAAMVIWSLLMPYLIHNNIQDWLERGYWGKTKIASEKYKTSDLELLELKKALAG